MTDALVRCLALASDAAFCAHVILPADRGTRCVGSSPSPRRFQLPDQQACQRRGLSFRGYERWTAHDVWRWGTAMTTSSQSITLDELESHLCEAARQRERS